MTSNDNDRPMLFLATPTVDGLDGPGVAFDGSEEAMRRLRHPFAVNPDRPAQRRVAAVAKVSDNSKQYD